MKNSDRLGEASRGDCERCFGTGRCCLSGCIYDCRACNGTGHKSRWSRHAERIAPVKEQA